MVGGLSKWQMKVKNAGVRKEKAWFDSLWETSRRKMRGGYPLLVQDSSHVRARVLRTVRVRVHRTPFESYGYSYVYSVAFATNGA